MDTWIDLNHSIRNLALKDTFVFLTDDAVGSREEENLGHLAANVGSDARCFELRMYTATNARGDIDMLHQRFREQEVAIFEKHGAEVVAVWQRLDDPNTLVWMLAYRDRAHRQEVWAGFAADPDWATLRAKYPASVSIEAYWMSSTDYSNLR